MIIIGINKIIIEDKNKFFIFEAKNKFFYSFLNTYY